MFLIELPYIKRIKREPLDPILQQLWNTLKKNNETLDDMKGDVNYCFTKILVTMLEKFGFSYAHISNIAAIPADVWDEFKAAIMRPYEVRKKNWNGEIKHLVI